MTVEFCGNRPPRVSLCRHEVYEKQPLRLGPQLTVWFTTQTRRRRRRRRSRRHGREERVGRGVKKGKGEWIQTEL